MQWNSGKRELTKILFPPFSLSFCPDEVNICILESDLYPSKGPVHVLRCL